MSSTIITYHLYIGLTESGREIIAKNITYLAMKMFQSKGNFTDVETRSIL